MSSKCDWNPVSDITCMVYAKIYVEKVWLLLCLVDLSLALFEEIYTRNLIHFEYIFPWIHDRFMRMVHVILHSMVMVINAGYVRAFMYPLSCMVIYLRLNCVWTVIFTRPPTQWFSNSPCGFSSCFDSSTMRGVFMKIYVSNDVSVGKGDLWHFNNHVWFSLSYCLSD